MPRSLQQHRGLPALEYRTALFDEGGDALEVVLGCGRDREALGLAVGMLIRRITLISFLYF
jgi:hypothetical protein